VARKEKRGWNGLTEERRTKESGERGREEESRAFEFCQLESSDYATIEMYSLFW